MVFNVLSPRDSQVVSWVGPWEIQWVLTPQFKKMYFFLILFSFLNFVCVKLIWWWYDMVIINGYIHVYVYVNVSESKQNSKSEKFIVKQLS